MTVQMYFIVYETTNLINGKKYRGAHICKRLDDSYLGSGVLLKKAISKYGFENFKRKILIECDSVESMFIHEAQFVNADWVDDPNTYNLKIGGEGGWDYINKNGLRWDEEKKRLWSIEMKKKRISGEWAPKNPTYGFKNKTHSIKSKQKISENNVNRFSDEELSSRIDDWNRIPNKRGKVKILSNLWGVSHTQVRRFALNNNLILSQ
jgi:hypothetical protein